MSSARLYQLSNISTQRSVLSVLITLLSVWNHTNLEWRFAQCSREGLYYSRCFSITSFKNYYSPFKYILQSTKCLKYRCRVFCWARAKCPQNCSCPASVYMYRRQWNWRRVSTTALGATHHWCLYIIIYDILMCCSCWNV